MNGLPFFFIFILLLSCSSSDVIIRERGSDRLHDLTPRIPILINQLSKDLSFEEEIKLWDRFIENHYTPLYDSFLWRSKGISRLDPRRVFYYALSFSYYKTQPDRTSKLGEEFYREYHKSRADFKSRFPTAKLNTETFFVPVGIGFSAGAAYSEKNERGKYTLVYGADVFLTDDLDFKRAIIFHELMHLYHFERREKLGENRKMKFSKIRCLYFEGAASWGVSQFGLDPLYEVTELDEEDGMFEHYINNYYDEVKNIESASSASDSDLNRCSKYVGKDIDHWRRLQLRFFQYLVDKIGLENALSLPEIQLEQQFRDYAVWRKRAK